MSSYLLDLVRELNTLNDDNLADRVITDSDVQWCLSELQDILEAEQPTITPPNELERMKKIMRYNGIMVIPSKYPGGRPEWNIPKPCGQKEKDI